MKIIRSIQNQISEALDLGKIAIIYGARQTGKTTLSLNLAKAITDNFTYLNCDEPDVSSRLTEKTSTELKQLIGNKKLIIIDEAQRVGNIGITIKLVHDTYPDIKIIVTGSSSLDLANMIVEPLTGRSVEFQLFPISLTEMIQNDGELNTVRLLDNLLIYGSYPGILPLDSATKIQQLNNLSNNYLYKDIFKFQELKKPDLIFNLLQSLAYRIGSEVSLNELANKLEVDKQTIKRYLELLEKAFVIYRLRPLARNKRNEVGKFKKFYFYDLGIRNSLIGNFNSIDVRNDVGALWENFCIMERLKTNQVTKNYPNYYFWRNYLGSEVDLIEEWGGKLNSFEFKYNLKRTPRVPTAFATSYPNYEFKVIKKENVMDLIKT